MTTSTNQTDTTPSGHAEDQFWDLIQRAVTSQVPAEVTERSVNSIRDTLAVGVAGTREAVARASADSLCPTSGLEREAATVWASGERVAVADAAWANAIAMHCLDWDDYMHPMHGHCTSVLAAVYLALGEEMGASGDQLLRAYIAGYDVNGALGAVLSTEHYAQGWHATSTIGVIGAAATASVLLHLTREETLAALGIAASHASGLRVNFGYQAKPLHAGLAARNGVLAARLAARGVTAAPDWFLGSNGFLSTYRGRADVEEARVILAEAPSAVHAIMQPSGLVQKAYAACGCSHTTIAGLLNLRAEHGIKPDQVEQIELHVDPHIMRTLTHTTPSTGEQARYCLPFCAAVAIIDGVAGVEQFTDSASVRPDVHELMSRVRIVVDRDNGPEEKFATHIRVRTQEGEVRALVRVPPGHPNSPMTDAQLRSKFEHCVGPGTGGVVESLWAVLGGIPDVTAREVVAAITSVTAPRREDVSPKAL